jgi:tyrosine-protein phosphatase SIW14
MKLLGFATLTLVLMAWPWSLRGQASGDADLIPRFRQVAEGFYRGGQPRREGFAYLKKLGVKTVINLRRENDEQAEVQKLDMKYLQISLSAWERVPEGKIQRFLQVLRDRDNYPVFVHCERGADRVGFMVGLYRIALQGWDADQAYNEARALGMRWWYFGLKHQLYEFAEKQAAAKHRAYPP